MNSEKAFDLAIIGVGPAGCAMAHSLKDSGLSIVVFDKAVFPRDKICGDALSADVVNQLNWMDPKLLETFKGFERKLPSQGVRFISPSGYQTQLDYSNKRHKELPAGFISKRIDFDSFLFDQIKDQSNVTVFQDCGVEDLNVTDECVEIDSSKGVFTSKMIVGADGAHSIVERKLTANKIDKNHYAAGLRCYYENVTGFSETGHIELHFSKKVLPGYFWVFPLANNQANVGLGMLSSQVKDKNLKQIMLDIIEDTPSLKERFKGAKPIEKIKGFGLPIGSKKKPLSGNRFILLGDAASLIDPFTGEGIGNALRSGRFGAEHIKACFEAKQFDSVQNKKYDELIYNKVWYELKISRSMQLLSKHAFLLNYVIKKASKSSSFKKLLTAMLDDIDLKSELTKPSFYFKLFFNS